MKSVLALLTACVVGSNASQKLRVLVVGAGQSGIVSAHYLSQHADVVVVEKRGDLGGVWHPDQHYPLLAANNARDTFVLPDLPADPTVSDFPTLLETQAYLQRYTDHFDLRKLIRFNVAVTNLTRELDASAPFGYKFHVAFNTSAAPELAAPFDFVVFATGYTHVPHVPVLPGAEAFAGKLVHSSQITEKLVKVGGIKGKKVVVLGGGKSALDVAVWATTANASNVHLVTRQTHWAAPRYIGNESPDKGKWNQNVLYSRLSQAFLPTCRDCNNRVDEVPFLVWLVQNTAPGLALRDLFWKNAVTADIVKQYSYPEWLVPPAKFADDCKYLSVLHLDMISLMSSGKIQVHLCRHATTLDTNAVRLAPLAGCSLHKDAPSPVDVLDADVVIFGTGYTSSLDPIMSEEIHSKLFNARGQVQLFRAAHNPDLPGLGFVGFGHNINTMLSAAMAARWVSEYAKGSSGALARTGVLADLDEVRRQIRAALAFDFAFTQASGHEGTQVTPGYFRGSSIFPYVDAILGDLGLESYRGSSWLAEFTGPQINTLYAGLDQALADPDANAPTDYRPFFWACFAVFAGLQFVLCRLVCCGLCFRRCCGSGAGKQKKE